MILSLLMIRKWAAQLEILRCIIYFPFDYYFIESVEWSFGRNETMLVYSTLWSVRFFHILSIIFWISYHIYYTYFNNNNNCDYMMASDGEKDIESDTSSVVARRKCTTFFMIFGFLVAMFAFLTAWATRLDSCAKMLNEW